MKPRLKNSKKWTNFPPEYLEQIEKVFAENFVKELSIAKLKIEGRIFPSEITLRVAYLENGRLASANFEVSSDYSLEAEDAIEQIHHCVDVAASMMTEYFESNGEVDFPYLWKKIKFAEKEVYVQFSTENLDLEAQANRLLGIDEDAILQEVDEKDTDALAHSEISEEISPARDDEDYETEDEDSYDEADNSPRMFGNITKKKKEDMH